MAPDSLVVRVAAPEDDQAIGDLLVRTFNETYAKKGFAFPMSPAREADLRDVPARRSEGTVLVALRNGELAGTVSLFPWGAPHNRAWIPGAVDLRQLAVKPELHGHGIGPQLMDEAEGLCRSWKAPAVCLHVRKGVSGVARMYQARGYVRAPEGDREQGDVSLEAYRLTL